MLLLFNPWRDIRGLKNGHESFGRAFIEFEQVMTSEVGEQISHPMVLPMWFRRG
jgi:hypothetical protein